MTILENYVVKSQTTMSDKTKEQIRTSEDFKQIKGLWSTFERIEQKNRCLRVRFLDWLSEKVAYYGRTWSVKIKKVSDNIHSPCVIKLKD
jgi:hypothetical protein